MDLNILTQTHLQEFQQNLYREEKSGATIEKYLRDARVFLEFAKNQAITKELVIAFKNWLVERAYAVRSVNSMLASVNSLLNFLGWGDCKTKSLRQQRQTYCPEEKELTKGEYLRLLQVAARDPKLHLVMQTICGTGIRVSELCHFTVEAVAQGEVSIRCKNKTRRILLPGKLKKLLLEYAKKHDIQKGRIFVAKDGKPLSRVWVWAQMKRLCEKAGVLASKVFPHNLRKLFARTFYGLEKDIAQLADLLGHSSINTTRIYIMSTGREHRQKLEQLGLVL